MKQTDSNTSVEIVLVTGMSGAGKSQALRVLEDIGFSAVDNIAPALLSAVVDHAVAAGFIQIAVVTDARSGDEYARLLSAVDGLREKYSQVTLMFLDATDDILIQRYKETRRPHPLHSPHCGVLTSIRTERHMLADAREAADRTIDTSSLTIPGLRVLIDSAFGDPSAKAGRLITTITSFGFKYGIPIDADLVFDVRFLRNPYWIPELKDLDGTCKVVWDYVASDPTTKPLLGKLYDLVDFSMPHYHREGKSYLTIAVGCTGGQHRSVVVGDMLAGMLQEKGHRVVVQHRDIAVGKSREH
jgi:UPF0042 nucleotide-binding protein